MGSISINSGGDAVSATFTMDGDAMAVYGPGINIVSSPPPLTLTKASYTTPAESAGALQTALQQVQVAPLDVAGGINSKFGYQGNITMYLTVTDLVNGQSTTKTIDDTEFNPSTGPITHTTIGPNVTYDVPLGSVVSGLIVNGGFVNNEGTLAFSTVSNGGNISNNEGITIGTTLGNGGTMSQQGSSLSYGTIINSGGLQEAYNGFGGGGLHESSVNAGGVQSVYGANCFNTEVNSGGLLHVSGGNIIETLFTPGESVGAVINHGGMEVVEGTPGPDGPYYGQADTTTVDLGGTLEVHTGGVATNAMVNPGGVIDNDSLAVNTTLNGGTMNDNAGGTAESTTINKNGVQQVWGGSTASGDVINSGGQELVEGAGSSMGSIINSGGFEGVWGNSTGSTINAGGRESVYNGGIDRGMTIGTCGLAFIRAGGQETGVVDFSSPGAELTLQTAASGYQNADIAGFATGDKIDFADISFSSKVQALFSGPSDFGTLTVGSGANHGALSFVGAYDSADFAVSNDGVGGTLVKYV